MNPIQYTHRPEIDRENYAFSETLFLDDPELQDDIPTSYLSHKELYEQSVAKACKVFTKIRALQDEGKGGVENFM